jgi:hypothetical protein
VAFIVLFGREVSCRRNVGRPIWPKAIRLNGNDPIAVIPNGPVDARIAAVSKLSSPSRTAPFLDGLVMLSVFFVMMNPSLGVGALWCITRGASRAILLGLARSC